MDNGYGPVPDDNTNHVRYNCPPGYDGEYCQVPRTPCGHRFPFFGETCLRKPLENRIEYFCNCAAATRPRASTTPDGSASTRQRRSARHPIRAPSSRIRPTRRAAISSASTAASAGSRTNPTRAATAPERAGTRDSRASSGPPVARIIITTSSNSSSRRGRRHRTMPKAPTLTNRTAPWTSPSDPSVDNAYNAPGGEEIDYNNAGVVIHQENPSDVACNLRCFDGGSCWWGKRNSGGTWLSTVDNSASLDRRTYDPNYYQHRVCPAGYNGLYCEYEIQTAPMHAQRQVRSRWQGMRLQ